MSFLLALLLSTNLQAADYKASCKGTVDGELCNVSLYSCSQVGQDLADEICHSKGWTTGTIDPHGQLIGEDSSQCGITPGGPYTYVGCSNN